MDRMTDADRFAWDEGDIVIEMEALVAANPWHDELGRFAPKGYGTDRPVTTAVFDPRGNTYTVTAADGTKIEMSGDGVEELTDEQRSEALNSVADCYDLAPLEGAPPRIVVHSDPDVSEGVFAWVKAGQPNVINLVGANADWDAPYETHHGMPSEREVSKIRFTASHEYGHSYLYMNEMNGEFPTVLSTFSKREVRDTLSEYGRISPIEGHAEAFAEYFGTAGSTKNAAALRFAADLGWRDELPLPKGLAAAASTEIPIAIYETTDGPIYEYADGTIERIEEAPAFSNHWSAWTVEFANPWHDEIGRFAPKGYVRTGGKKIGRERRIPLNADHADMVLTLKDLIRTRREAPHALGAQRRFVQELSDLSKNPDADPEFVERLIKPASRAISEDNFEEAQRLIDAAEAESFETFVEEFEIADLEPINMTEVTGTVPSDRSTSRVWETTTPEGNRIQFHSNGYDVTEEQVMIVLSTMTTAARIGGVDADLTVRVAPSYDRSEDGIPSRNTQTMGFVGVDPFPNGTRHRTVNLTPELMNGNFDQGGSTPTNQEYGMASAAFLPQIRKTAAHEMGHVSLFEESIHNRPNGKAWYEENMRALAQSVVPEEIPLVSAYGQENVVELHAELFSEWVNTGGTTNNPLVRRVAEQFEWINPNETDIGLAAAAGRPPHEPLIPYFPFPESPVILVDGADGPSYIHEALVAANPWHDEIGRFAPKGTGRKFDAATAAQDVINGRPVSVTGAEAVDLVLEFADLDHPTDLTLVTVDGSTAMFSEMRGRGRPRLTMPQIPKDFHDDFEQRLRDAGIDISDDWVDPRELRATQSELDGTSVGGMLRNARNGGFDPTARSLWISSDGHILDGHHRWAVAAIESAACDGCVKMPVHRIDMPMSELLPFADQFTDDLDITRRGHGEGGAAAPRQIAAAGAQTVPVEIATDEEDGITAEQLADLPHGDGSAFEAPESE